MKSSIAGQTFDAERATAGQAVTGHVIHARAPRGDDCDLEPITDPDRIAAHLEDAAHVPGGHAPALLLPRNEREVADALSRSTRVLVVGAQSSLTGGATPRGDTLLSTARLRSLADVPVHRVSAGAAVTIAEIDTHLRQRGAFYPPSPTWQGATIGGTVATNAAGASTFKYGTTRAWVEALTVVLASGDVLDLRRGNTTAHPDGYFDVVLQNGSVRVPVPRYRMPTVAKVSAGYFAAPGMDLVDLFIGSEGTLGVIAEVTLRVQHPRPAVCLAFVTFRERASAVACVTRLREMAIATWRSGDSEGLDVSAIEHMDGRSLALVREDGVDTRLGITLDPDAAIGLLITVDLTAGTTSREAFQAFGGGTDHSAAARPLAHFASMLDEYDVAAETLIAAPGDAAGVERLLALREAVPVAVNRRVGVARRDIDPRIEKTAADVIVPFEHLATMLDRYDDELRRRGLDGAIWGHISDGNVHPNIIPRSFADVESGREAVLAFGREAIRLGGSPLAEHGVGRNTTKQRLLVDLYGADGVEEMRLVKRALDPQGKLASGVIFQPG
jgi:D-lactate dehydrogenase (cytochrome)